MNPPEDSGLSLAWILDHAWLAIAGLLGVVWNQNKDSIKEHKEASEKALTEHKAMNAKMHEDTHEELKLQRGYIGKLFENAEDSRRDFSAALAEHRKDSADRHIELLTAIHTGLAGKADK